MEDIYRIDDDPAATISCLNGDGNLLGYLPINNNGVIQIDDERDMEVFGSEMFDLIKSQIVTHPRFPNLISAYLECRKLGAPAEVASLLDEIGREVRTIDDGCCSTEIGINPELDEFMESYCLFLSRYKNELSKPLDEATTFLCEIERQFSELFIEESPSPTSKRKKSVVTCNSASDDEETACYSEEEKSCSVEVEAPLIKKPSSCVFHGDPALKEMLLQKYSGYLSSLRTQFLKKKRNGKLPKDSGRVLLEWWNTHYRWPYPTEEEKMKLCEITGLNHKQITNWFINQRKRHWKPSEDQRIALVNCLSDTGAPLMLNSENG